MRKRVSWIPSLAVLALVSVPAAAVAQNSAGPDALVQLAGVQSDGIAPQSLPEFGVNTPTSIVLVAHAFNAISSTLGYEFTTTGGNLGIYKTAGTSPWVEAPLTLPNGSQIESFEFRFCDNSATAAFASFLTINDRTGSVSINQPTLVTSTNAETPGCINRTFTPLSPIVIDNANKAYSLEVNLGQAVTDTSIVLGHARVNYRLNVSPDPAGATFSDVPNGHPFHRYVEALAAAGITGGCGGGQFCVNQPVTRGQMAVFLSVALGLHFPN